MNDDTSLLRSYADEKSEAAFAELVRRHLDLVYGAALRRTGGDAHNAADVAQQVFTNLARNARQLSRHTVVSAWLYTATRNAALNLMISDQRRKSREAAALALHAADASDPNWERLRPLLDEAIDELPEEDRTAVVLRFLEQQAFAEIGATLRLSEDTARKRVDRALEKLRAALARRGVKSTGAALAAAFANEVAASAPAGLAGAISGTALASMGTGALAAAGAGILMSIKSTVMVSVVALVAIGSTVLQWTRARRAEVELASLALDRDSLRAQLGDEQARAKRSAQAIASLQGAVDALKAKQPAMTATPQSAPPPIGAAAATHALSPEELELSQKIIPAVKAATDAYRAAHNGQPPPHAEALIPYFASPQEGADFVEWFEAQKAAAKKN